MVRCMEDEVPGITLEKFRAVHKMGALVHYLDKTGEARQPVQCNRERLVKEAIGRDADHDER